MEFLGFLGPLNMKILNFFMFTRSDSLIRFQRALNHYLEIILSQEMSKTAQKCVLGPKCPYVVNCPQTPIFSKKTFFFFPFDAPYKYTSNEPSTTFFGQTNLKLLNYVQNLAIWVHCFKRIDVLKFQDVMKEELMFFMKHFMYFAM